MNIIKKWKDKRAAKKVTHQIDKIKESLIKDPVLFINTKQKFEAAFGKDSRVRTKEQWQRLVKVYGMKTVCLTEKMTEEQVRHMMVETYDEKLKKRLRAVQR